MVSNDTTTEQLDALLQSVILKEGIRDAKIQVKAGTEKGDGYVGIMSFIEISGVSESGKPVVLNIMAKRAPQNEAVRTLFPIRGIYEREIYIYTELKYILEELEREHNVEEKFELTKCLGTSFEEYHECLLLEHLRFSGYRMWNRMTTMDEDHMKLLLDKYAQFHAFSFALRDQKPELFKEIKDKCPDQQKEEDLEKFSHGFDPQMDCLVEAFKDDERIVNYVQKLKSGWFLKMKELYERNKKDVAGVITHGDCWCNNMMFKYENKAHPEKPTHVILLDWQMAKYANVCNDLCYFFYCSSSQSVIDNYKSHIRYYYARLAFHVNALGSNLENMYSFEKFMEDWTSYRQMGVTIAVLMVKLMVTNKDEALDITEAAKEGENFMESFNYKTANEDLYLSRMKGLLLHFVNLEDQDTKS